MQINGYRAMWIIAMFDLPSDTKKARKDYTRFRKSLLVNGFTQMQYSVYSRPCPSKENTEAHIRRIQAYLPPDGEVRILSITDKQFERMQIFFGKMRYSVEKPPAQLELF